MSPDPSGNDPSRLAPPFFASEPARPSPQPTPETSTDPGAAASTDADAATASAAGTGAAFPWEVDPPEQELVLTELVESPPEDAEGQAVADREPDASEATGEQASDAEATDDNAGDEGEAESFPADVFFVPEGAESSPVGTTPGRGIPMHDPEAVAERLEQLARRLRHGGAEGLAERIASADRFEAVVAATIAGYFAGLHEREE